MPQGYYKRPPPLEYEVLKTAPKPWRGATPARRGDAPSGVPDFIKGVPLLSFPQVEKSLAGAGGFAYNADLDRDPLNKP